MKLVMSKLKKHLSVLLLISLLFLAFSELGRCEYQSAPASLAGWQVENIGIGAYCSESNGVFNLGTHGGPDCPSIALYKEVNPTGDFNFSMQVKANVNESCAMFLRGFLPMRNSTFGVTFEYGYFGVPVFQFVRTNGGWAIDNVTYSSAIEWYTMQMSVYASPFKVQVSAFFENGSLVGSKTYTESDIDNFRFSDIKYIGFYAWGYSPGDYLFRNIEGPFDYPTTLSINTECASTTAGSAVNVFGTLSDSNNTALQNKTIILSYTFPGLDSWIPISSAQTDEQGNYNIQWINSASGTFTLRTEWGGDGANAYVSNTTTLNFLPIENESTFVIESNSTVNGLEFNNGTSTLSFNVTGPSGTTGYVRATIPKSMLADGEALQAFIDGSPLNYTLTGTADSWIFTFSYHHSTHQISMHLVSNAQVTEPAQAQPQGSGMLLIGLIILFAIILTVGTISLLRFRRLSQKSLAE